MISLKKNNEFQTIYNYGKKTFGYYALIFYKKNNNQINKYGFVVSKKIGNAICRNRIKRLFKEYCRNNNTKLKQGYDIILIGKKTAGEKFKNLSYEEMKKDLEHIFKNAKLYQN